MTADCGFAHLLLVQYAEHQQLRKTDPEEAA
jgi:hypothetical protein